VTAGLRSRFGMDGLAAHEVAAHLTAGLLLAPSLAAMPVNASLSGLAAAGSS
jgi:hypothetical protein